MGCSVKLKELLLCLTILFISCYQSIAHDIVTIAIIPRNEPYSLPLYLACIENQTWPKEKTYLYIRSTHDNDEIKTILRTWIDAVKDQYLGIHFDDSEIPANIDDSGWNQAVFDARARINQESVNWAYEHQSSYCVVSGAHFITPSTIESLMRLQLPIVAPLLKTETNMYSNYHAEIDVNGYYKDCPLYYQLWNQEIKGLIGVPVVHSTYLIRHDMLPHMSFADNSNRYDYVIFSDNARKNNIPQYIDTREVYGCIIFAQDGYAFASQASNCNLKGLRSVAESINKRIENTVFLLNILAQEQCAKIYASDFFTNHPDVFGEEEFLKEYIMQFPFELYELHKVTNHGDFFLDKGGDIIKRILRRNIIWEPVNGELIKKFSREGSVVVDIGAHIGTHVISMSNCVGAQGSVWAFEPQRKIYRELVMNLALNKLNNVKTKRCALGNETKTIAMCPASQPLSSNEGSTHVCTESTGIEQDVAEMRTLDSFNLTNVSFMKIDAEGSEDQVLEGARETIMRNRPVMIIEICGNFVFDQAPPDIKCRIRATKGKLKAMGYNVTHISDADYLAIPREKASEILGTLAQISEHIVE